MPIDDSLKGEDDEFFRGVKERRFASPDYLSEDLGVHAVEKLLERTGTSAADIDLIICACMFPDTFWPGVAPGIQHRVGASRATMVNIDTSCSSFLSGLNMADAYINGEQAEAVVVLMINNFVSRLPELWELRSAAPLGDGAAAALVTRGRQSIIARHERSHGEHYGIFRFEPDLVDGEFRNYWERGSGPIHVAFTPEMTDRIRQNAEGLVPEAVLQCMENGGIAHDDVSLLITHQPNTMLIEEWRRRIGIGPPRVYDTLAQYGNMFQASIAVTMADALEVGKLNQGDVVLLGTFSNGGDFVSALAIQW